MFKGSSSNSVFSKNVNGSFASGDAVSQVLVGMYTKLSDVVETINTLMTEYSKGNFYVVANILTHERYNKLAISLANLAASQNKYPDYETIRMSSTSALAGLYQSILQYSAYVDVQAQLEISRERESILYDRVKLKEFIEKMNQNRRLFPDSNVQTIRATVKPEYAAYIKQFGFPEGAVFDPDKLAFILQQLSMG